MTGIPVGDGHQWYEPWLQSWYVFNKVSLAYAMENVSQPTVDHHVRSFKMTDGSNYFSRWWSQTKDGCMDQQTDVQMDARRHSYIPSNFLRKTKALKVTYPTP